MIRTGFNAYVVLSNGITIPTMANLEYDPADPFAVSLMVMADAGTGPPWFFARDLLAAGLLGHSGDGDLKITISEDTVGFTLMPGTSDQCDVLLPRPGVVNFLAQTISEYPPGLESVDWDGFIDGLTPNQLGGEAA